MENPGAYDVAFSITGLDDIETLFLVMTVGEGWRCPMTLSEQVYVSLKKRGVLAKLGGLSRRTPRERGPDRAIHGLEQLEDWSERHDPILDATTAADDSDHDH